MKNSREQIKSIDQAVLILGQNGLRQLITSVASRRIINMNGGFYTKTCALLIWQQSEDCAAINRKIALERAAPVFDAFLLGLVQYIGLIVALRIADELVADASTVGSTEFYEGMRVYAGQMSCKIAHEWKFSDAIIVALQ